MVEAVMAVKILITGSTGKLGKELVKAFPKSLAPPREQLDISNKDNVSSFIEKNRPQAIIHCAALTGIRECEDNKELAWDINVEGTENLIKACEEFAMNCYFVHVSTACVFCGDRGNYTEEDIPYPKNFYSLTKLLAEFVVKYSALRKWLIIRTNFVPREKWPYPKAFADRFGTYLFADDLARAIKQVMNDSFTGTLHVCGKDRLSMFELAKITTSDVQPMSLADYKGPPLTIDMTLKSIKIKPFTLTRDVVA
jgi:dTDP-4-dehydrorhamnose reductase